MKVIVLLGNTNSPDCELSPIAKSRADAAIAEFEADKLGSVLIPTGGKGRHFNVSDRHHAEILSSYLVERGIPAQRIYPSIHSRNTLEDIQSVGTLIRERWPSADKVVFVTSKFHLPRVKFIVRWAWASKSKRRRVKFVYVGVDYPGPGEELDRLLEHESKSLAALKNLERYP